MKHVTRNPIHLQALIDTVAAPHRGGCASFLGTVRAGPDDGEVTMIEYSAYEEMLEAELARIVAEAESKWADCGVAAVHRLGTVPVGEASIGIVAAAPHRSESFDACRYVIEEAKKRLPVWKKEFLDDGSDRWREESTWPSPSS